MTEKVAEFEEKDCIQCGKVFRFYAGEKEDYLQKGLQEPKRCKGCREQNRIRKLIKDEVKVEVERVVSEKLAELNK